MSAPAEPQRRRPTWVGWLVAVLLATPVVELVVFIWVVDWLGGWWALLLLVVSAFCGALILARRAPTTFRRVRQASRAGRVPTPELAEAALTVLGGVLLLVPGFVTDVLALACLLPPTRSIARWAVQAALARWVLRMSGRSGGGGPGPVIQGQVLPPDDDDRPRPGG